MNDFYSFLARPDIHPLIKSAAAQAYLLAARPFPDGNERLSRIISELILYRSGYDYFRDITISGKIARESYRYYKNMRELLREENDADMTCFVEYYIDLLARALTEAKEDAAKREMSGAEETIAREREMAAVPFGEEANPKSSRSTQEGHNPSETEEAEDIIESLCTSDRDSTSRIGHTLKRIMARGISRFSVKDWEKYAAVDPKQAKNDCYYLRKKGIVENIGSCNLALYRLCFEDLNTESQSEKPAASTPEKPSVTNTEPTSENLTVLNTEPTPEKQTLDKEPPSEKPSGAYLNRLYELQGSENAQKARYAKTLLQLIREKRYSFSSGDWSRISGISMNTSHNDLWDAIDMGLVYRTWDKTRYVYHIGQAPYDNNGARLSETQLEVLNQLHGRIDGDFTAAQAARTLGMNPSTFNYHFKRILSKGDIVAVPDSCPPAYRMR